MLPLRVPIRRPTLEMAPVKALIGRASRVRVRPARVDWLPRMTNRLANCITDSPAAFKLFVKTPSAAVPDASDAGSFDPNITDILWIPTLTAAARTGRFVIHEKTPPTALLAIAAPIP